MPPMPPPNPYGNRNPRRSHRPWIADCTRIAGGPPPGLQAAPGLQGQPVRSAHGVSDVYQGIENPFVVSWPAIAAEQR